MPAGIRILGDKLSFNRNSKRKCNRTLIRKRKSKPSPIRKRKRYPNHTNSRRPPILPTMHIPTQQMEMEMKMEIQGLFHKTTRKGSNNR
jgi:hypothetical protein